MNDLTDLDRAIYEWQLDVPGFGEEGQKILRNTTALVSRCGGLGGPICFSLAAAGFKKIIIAHAGDLRLDDLNRQILMRHDGIGNPRTESAAATLAAFNPNIEVETVGENITEENAADLVGRADLVFGAAPLFEERLLMNRECVRQNKPFVDSAMYNLEGRVIPIVPGQSACLACLYPEIPPNWKRRFPVIGAVSALAAQIGVLEGIKVLTGLGTANLNRMIYFDTASMRFQNIELKRNPECEICGNL
ncbi:MAG: HesA/MoeB/ThiF family protein [Verrucomicrobiales bacterium]|nr:HesA/MoeB/ThiF family protein [Verrucomicrobiales bacterium]